MKVLVIGRSGQVATALRERAGDHAVLCLGRPDVDLGAPATLRAAIAAHPADVVVNAAAYTAVDAAETDEAAAFAQNGVAPGILAEACAAAGTPFLHISTDYVFDGQLSRPYREDDPIAPQTAYGRSKAAGEAAVAAAGGASLIARTAWVYSPFGKNFLLTMLRLGAERDRLTVVADQHGNPTSALDMADAILALCERSTDWGAGEIVHMAGTGEATWHAFASAIMAAAGLSTEVAPVPTSAYPTPAKRPANSRLDCTRLAARYGLTLPDWRASTASTVARVLLA